LKEEHDTRRNLDKEDEDEDFDEEKGEDEYLDEEEGTPQEYTVCMNLCDVLLLLLLVANCLFHLSVFVFHDDKKRQTV
jgi:hypothetical protein